MDKQQEICVACGWCCKHDVFRAPQEALEVFWTRGHDIIYDYRLEDWFVIVDQQCQHFNKLCTIYDKRPQGCKDWMCPSPNGDMHIHLNLCRDIANKSLTTLFGERKQHGTRK